ncbi:MAG TPA: hypothetical protein VGO69_07445 [Pyrinomonadaceae bacterium]|nr:hypothetical protein [Pyrinomonadaceae bacterium]
MLVEHGQAGYDLSIETGEVPMAEVGERARRIADAVLSAKPVKAEAKREMAAVEKWLQPLTELMVSAQSELSSRRSEAMISSPQVRSDKMMHEEDYIIRINAGEYQHLIFGIWLTIKACPCLLFMVWILLPMGASRIARTKVATSKDMLTK